MIIRNYQPSDYDQMIANQRAAENNMYNDNWDSRANFEYLTKLNPSNILVAEMNGGGIVGSLLICPLGPDQATLYRVTTKNEFQKQGIATELLKKATEVLRERGVTEIGMFVNSSNQELLDFYSKRGFSSSSTKTFKYLWKATK
jgi:ribosomal protein S18 acetylase RimI-like enzyme